MKNIAIVLAFIFLFLIFNFKFLIVYADTATFTLTPPSGQLARGQNVDFTIGINTNSATVTSQEVGMSYDATKLQFVSVAPVDTFTQVTSSAPETGKLVLVGTSDNGYSGTGTFAKVTFKIIASSPDSTELCVLYTPSSPTPQPTALPKSGSTNQYAQGAIIMMGLFLIVISGIFLQRKSLH